MAVLDLKVDSGVVVFDEAACRAAGKALHDQYVAASPFPSIVIDDFLDPDLLRKVVAEFPRSDGKTHFDRSQERLKYQYPPSEWSGPVTHSLFAAFNSDAFVGFLEEMTGISGLIVDPSFVGGGLHETKRGGHLGVHADFNQHVRLNVVRQLNLLVYLNEDWDESYGGNLELWDKGMKTREVSVLPVLGRAVVFTTTLDSYHGQPDPVTCPPELSRRSMALYYYKAVEGGLATLPKRTTAFQVRPKSADQVDWRIRSKHLIDDWVPPVIRRRIKRI
ncbi:2OG-Fe(II) oxygenase [Sphingomonas sp. PAMC 26617]|uniref:2OG-Fe(II) oxygenase n=1 Tax=Sphingomonas sp. PAMC 26617 TaxID=1112216 RepID=UPI0002898B9C|nr:2OG-Fe(II) oxygenase [Sphingomonas sp. PAMC 26617]